MRISQEDKQFIEQNFSGLKFYETNSGLVLKGKLHFVAYYDNNDRSYEIFATNEKYSDDSIIEDVYDIEIDLTPTSDFNLYRNVRETGGKIQRVADKFRKVIGDLHVFPDGKLCLIGYLDENSEIDLRIFLLDVVIPFFYDQSYFSLYKKWPRGEYHHAFLGLFENYYDNIKKLDSKDDEKIKKLSSQCLNFFHEVANLSTANMFIWNKVKKIIANNKSYNKKVRSGKLFCFCGTGLPREQFSICHRDAYKGFNLLRGNLRKFGLKKLIKF